MSQSPPVFGRRGAAPGARAVNAPASPSAEAAPSAAYLELVAAARSTFSGAGPDDALETPTAATRPGGDEADVRAYMGPAFLRYEDLWRRCGGAPTLRSSLSLPAAIFGGVWLLYRKVYVAGALLVLAQASLLMAPFLWARVGELAIAAALHRYGKSIVLIFARRKVRALRAHAASPAEAERRIEAAGGASWLAPALGLTMLAATLYGAEAQQTGTPLLDMPDWRAIEGLFPPNP